MKPRSIRRKFTIKTKTSRFDRLVARYYPAVYSLASRMTDDPRQAVVLAHDALESTRKRLGNRRGPRGSYDSLRQNFPFCFANFSDE
jgi:DNA-directed RNA polymerase specialized sigma24 family protein